MTRSYEGEGEGERGDDGVWVRCVRCGCGGVTGLVVSGSQLNVVGNNLTYSLQPKRRG